MDSTPSCSKLPFVILGVRNVSTYIYRFIRLFLDMTYHGVVLSVYLLVCLLTVQQLKNNFVCPLCNNSKIIFRILAFLDPWFIWDIWGCYGQPALQLIRYADDNPICVLRAYITILDCSCYRLYVRLRRPILLNPMTICVVPSTAEIFAGVLERVKGRLRCSQYRLAEFLRGIGTQMVTTQLACCVPKGSLSVKAR